VQLGTSDYPCCFVRPYAAALARTDQKLKECEEDSVQLDAWQFAFGTTQLTHAIARLEKAVANRDRLARENEELRTIVVQFDACINDLIEDRDTADMIVKARNTQYFHRKIVAALAGGKGERK
jgi:predicted transcriptional regulator